MVLVLVCHVERKIEEAGDMFTREARGQTKATIEVLASKPPSNILLKLWTMWDNKREYFRCEKCHCQCPGEAGAILMLTHECETSPTAAEMTGARGCSSCCWRERPEGNWTRGRESAHIPMHWQCL